MLPMLKSLPLLMQGYVEDSMSLLALCFKAIQEAIASQEEKGESSAVIKRLQVFLQLFSTDMMGPLLMTLDDSITLEMLYGVDGNTIMDYLQNYSFATHHKQMTELIGYDTMLGT